VQKKAGSSYIRRRRPRGQLVAAAVAAAADRYTAKDVRLDSHTAAGLPAVRVDLERIGQVLANILDNALRHTAAGGTVTVSAAASGNDVELVVADTGEGIPTEYLPRLFERFYRVDTARDRTHGGSGIGLAIAKALAEAHAGRITATSAGRGRGAVFSVRLPVR
jgi:signal transduction histidine kinase